MASRSRRRPEGAPPDRALRRRGDVAPSVSWPRRSPSISSAPRRAPRRPRLGRVNALFAEMEDEGRRRPPRLAAWPPATSASGARRDALRRAGARGARPLPAGALTAGQRRRAHRRLRDRVSRALRPLAAGVAMEAINWRVVVSGPRARSLVRARRRSAAGERRARPSRRPRRAYFPEAGGYDDDAVYDRYRLGPGAPSPAPPSSRSANRPPSSAPARASSWTP